MEYLLDLKGPVDVALLGHSVCAPGWEMRDRRLPENELIVVYKGALHCEAGADSFSLRSGEACLIPRGQPNSQYCGEEPCRFFYAHFRDPLLPVRNLRPEKRNALRQGGDSSLEFFRLPPPSDEDSRLLLGHRMAGGPNGEELFTLFQKALIERNHDNLGRLHLISFYVTHALILLARVYQGGPFPAEDSRREQNPLVQEALRYLQSHCAEPVRIDALSRSLNISQQYLSRLFREELGMSPVKYLNRLRVERAKELMRSSGANISEAAFRSGFDNLYYFSRVFKQYEGIPPSTYRLWLRSRSNQ